MKKIIITLFVLSFFLWPAVGVLAAKAQDLTGKILIQVESYGRPWYVCPKDGQRYYLKGGNWAYETLKSLGIGIAVADLYKIPAKKGQRGDARFVNQVRGYVLIPDDNDGVLWYVNPLDGIRYSFKNGEEANNLIRRLGLGIKNSQLKLVAMNASQLVFDTTFNDVAYVKYHDGEFEGGYNADKILPPASMTKLMTALVLMDLDLDWEKRVVVSESQMAYPALYAGGDKTSEVDFDLGDTVSVQDLWVAMLVASSNQSAVALADTSGLPRGEFIALMNKKAKALGLKKTVFYDVSGLDSHNVTTSKEMALIARQAFSLPKIADTTLLQDYQINAMGILGDTKKIQVLNRNKSLLQYGPAGVKTGFLVEAQRTVSLKIGQDIIVVMHALSMPQRNKAITKLLN